MTSATERIRAMLDERGVEHYDGTNGTLWGKDAIGYRFSADELTSGRMSVHMWCETPEQAIAATLGTGTCHEVMINRHWRGCSECGYVWENMYGEGFQKGPNYCPMCGAKVVG